MKKVIRRGVFETNSSSTHSISIEGTDRYDELYFNDGRQLVVTLGEFGWGYDELYGVNEKLSYVLTYLPYWDHDITDISDFYSSIYFKWLSDVIKDYCGFDLVVQESEDDDLGYIDHQSVGMLKDVVFVDGEVVREPFWANDEDKFKENMKELIFNEKYYIIIDNDN